MPYESWMERVDESDSGDAPAAMPARPSVAADRRLAGWRDLPDHLRDNHLGFEQRGAEIIDRLTRRVIGRLVGGRFEPGA